VFVHMLQWSLATWIYIVVSLLGHQTTCTNPFRVDLIYTFCWCRLSYALSVIQWSNTILMRKQLNLTGIKFPSSYSHKYFTALFKGTRLPIPPNHFYRAKFLEIKNKSRNNCSHSALKPPNFNITNHNGNCFFCNSDWNVTVRAL